MLQSTSMLYEEHSNDAPACQPVAVSPDGAGTHKLVVIVARVYNETLHPAADVTPDEILGPSRLPDIAWARHLCAYLLVEHVGLTSTVAGRALGGRDHSTICNSRERIAAALAHDAALRRAVDRVRAALVGRDIERRRGRWEDDRRAAFAAATAAELAEYRYWRQRSLQEQRSLRAGYAG